jgi:hypothetical protein
MNEENKLMAASGSSRISEKHFTFYAFMSQKSESLTHSFFFDGFSSKVIFRVTQKSLRILLTSFRKPCSARLCLPALGIIGVHPEIIRCRRSDLSNGQCPLSAVCNS